MKTQFRQKIEFREIEKGRFIGRLKKVVASMITYHIGCWLIIQLLDRAVGRGYVEGKVSKSRVTSKLWVAIRVVKAERLYRGKRLKG